LLFPSLFKITFFASRRPRAAEQPGPSRRPPEGKGFAGRRFADIKNSFLLSIISFRETNRIFLRKLKRKINSLFLYNVFLFALQ
jgi:hypothetical protein